MAVNVVDRHWGDHLIVAGIFGAVRTGWIPARSLRVVRSTNATQSPYDSSMAAQRHCRAVQERMGRLRFDIVVERNCWRRSVYSVLVGVLV